MLNEGGHGFAVFLFHSIAAAFEQFFVGPTRLDIPGVGVDLLHESNLQDVSGDVLFRIDNGGVWAVGGENVRADDAQACVCETFDEGD